MSSRKICETLQYHHYFISRIIDFSVYIYKSNTFVIFEQSCFEDIFKFSILKQKILTDNLLVVEVENFHQTFVYILHNISAIL